MADLFESYEQEYCDLSADIKRDVQLLSSLTADKKKNTTEKIQRQIEEAEENIRSMEMEVHSVSSGQRDKLRSRLKNYQKDLTQLKRNFKQAKSQREVLLSGDYGTGANTSEEGRQRLLAANEQLDKSGQQIDQSIRIASETEDIGNEIMGNLNDQRNTIVRSRDRLRDTNSSLKRTRRTMNTMFRRVITNKVILLVIIVALLGVIVLILYFAVIRPLTSGGGNDKNNGKN